MSESALRVLVLGCGKTGSMVAAVAAERGHRVKSVDADVNREAAWLTPENLQNFDVVIDFTVPDAVSAHIAACLQVRKAMVVGTTGWYSEVGRVQQEVERAGTGFVYGANFSYGVNLFLQILRAAAPALTHGYRAHITERHHVQKKDAPSGTAVKMQGVLEDACGVRSDITSEREGDVTGTHTLELDASGDRITLTHDAKSRRTFAEGAVLAAEWIVGKTGFYDFKDIFEQI